MIRHALILTAMLSLCACVPSRGGGGGGDGPPTTGSSSAWLVLTLTSDEGESVSHAFMTWNNGAGLCAAARDYYQGYTQSYVSYYEETIELQNEYADVPDYETIPDYRRRSCEILVAYYDSYYGGGLFEQGTDFTSVILNPSEEEPAEGTYVLQDELSEDGDGEFTFDATRTLYLQSYSDIIADADCDEYATDPDAELFASDSEEVFAEYWSLVQGTLEVTKPEADAFHLTLVDGLEQEQEQEGDEQAVELDDTFQRCEVEYEYGAFPEG